MDESPRNRRVALVKWIVTVVTLALAGLFAYGWIFGDR